MNVRVSILFLLWTPGVFAEEVLRSICICTALIRMQAEAGGFGLF